MKCDYNHNNIKLQTMVTDNYPKVALQDYSFHSSVREYIYEKNHTDKRQICIGG
jgi:hypothetical protein